MQSNKEMTTQATKETIFGSEFRRDLEGSNQPNWLKALRETAFQYFTESGFPTVENEDWKYTNVAPMAKENFLLAEFSETAAEELEAENLEIDVENQTSSKTNAEVSAFVFEESKKSVLVFINGAFEKASSNLTEFAGAAILSFTEAAAHEKYGAIFKANLAQLVDSQ